MAALARSAGMYLFVWIFAILVQAAPLAAETLRVAVISDLNGSYGSLDYDPTVARAVDRIVAMKPDLVINTGDMVAGQKRNPHLTPDRVDAMWKAFHSIVTEPLEVAGIPMLVTPGNHDASDYSGFEEERKVFDRTWTEHSPDIELLDGERYPFRYAATLGGVLFISLDVTTVGALPAEEMDWLAQILREEGPRHKATVLFSHLPLWPFAEGRESEVIGDPALARLLSELKVDLYLSGHHHAYYPGVSGGVLYVSQACLGGGPRKLIGSDRVSAKAMTIIEIGPAGEIQDYALRGPDFEQPIDLATLPPSLGEGANKLIRRDLAQ